MFWAQLYNIDKGNGVGHDGIEYSHNINIFGARHIGGGISTVHDIISVEHLYNINGGDITTMHDINIGIRHLYNVNSGGITTVHDIVGIGHV